MKNLIKSIFLLSVVLFFLSCNKDNDTAEKFSTLSVEENKAIVENTGIDLIGVLDRMRDIQTVEAFGNLIELTESSKSKRMEEFRNTAVYSVIYSVHGCAERTKQVNDVFKSAVTFTEEDPESIQEFWDENVGTYTWNSSLGDWDEVLGGDKIIFKFPSSDDSNTNDATFTIYNYEGVFISNPIDDEYTGDLPVGVKADLKVGSTTLLNIVFSASYNTDGVPNAIAAEINMEGYKFEVDVTNNTELIAASYKFWENSDLVMKLSAAAEGLFTDDNIDDNTIHHSETNSYVCDWYWNESTQEWEEIWCNYTDEWDEVYFEEIVNSANAEFQVMNLAVRGKIDIKSLVDKIRNIEEDYDDEKIDWETYCEKESAEINKFLNLRLVNLDNNEIMAKAEAYVVHEYDEWGEDVYTSLRLIFGDGSPIDMETYFEEGFDDFINSLNNLLEDICYDYGIDYEPIDY